MKYTQTSLPFLEKSGRGTKKKIQKLSLNRDKFIQYLLKSVEINIKEAETLFVKIKNGLEKYAGKDDIAFLEKLLSENIGKWQVKKPLGTTSIHLTENAKIVLQKRYLLKNEKGEVVETPEQLFRRVAKAIAATDLLYDKKAPVKETEDIFYQMLANLEFLPNSPTLMNGGKKDGQLSACFVLPINDSMESIFETLTQTAFIQKTGGGTGFNFSKIRPKNSAVHSTHGTASGPLSFISMFNAVTDTIKQGGTRRGANMAILNVEHPDILEFIHSKEERGALVNFNISVAVTDAFMAAAEKGEAYELIHPQTGEAVGTLNAKKVFDEIVRAAWKTGDPGLIFIDRINASNPTPQAGRIESTNPCGEQPLLPYESCNLGSINLNAVLKTDASIDWEKLGRITERAVHFLDNVIDVNCYPLPQTAHITKANRKIGLGIMGLADVFVKMVIPYNSNKALDVAEKLISFIREKAIETSQKLAEKRGPFPNFTHSLLDQPGKKPIRNATVITIAPTGTLSLIAGCSSGIEPIFARSFVKNVLEGEKLPETYPGHVVTAHEISPEWHVRMQALFQKYSDNAVSKTVNLPFEAPAEAVEKAYWLAYKLDCKGITIYRDQSKATQVLQAKPTDITELLKKKLKGSLQIMPEKSGKIKIQMNVDSDHPENPELFCPECHTLFKHEEGCTFCPECGYMHCHS